MLRHRLLALAIAGAALIAAPGTTASAQAQTQAKGKVAIFKATSLLDLATTIGGEASTAAILFDKPTYGCHSIRRGNLTGQGSHNLLNLTDGYVKAFLDTSCIIPAPSIALGPPGEAAPNQGIHVDLANSFSVSRTKPFFFIGAPITIETGGITGLTVGPLPAYDAPLQFMPTPDGQLSADTNPGLGKCKPTNPLVHMVYNASPNWFYTYTDPFCLFPDATVAPGQIQHLFLGKNTGYQLLPDPPIGEGATAAVRAACRQQVSKSASRRAKLRAKRDAKNCERAAMFNQAAAAKAAKRRR